MNSETAQNHNFHDTGDDDWMMFHALAGKRYEILVSNQQSNSDVVLELYGPDGSTRLRCSDDFPGENELISWRCPLDGIYYVRALNYDGIGRCNGGGTYQPPPSGDNTGYDLVVYYPVGCCAESRVWGDVKDESGADVTRADVVAVISGRGREYSGLSDDSGYQLYTKAAFQQTNAASADGCSPDIKRITPVLMSGSMPEFENVYEIPWDLSPCGLITPAPVKGLATKRQPPRNIA